MTYCTRKVSRSIFNKHKTSTIRSLKNEPWITHESLELIKERDKLLLEFKRSNQKSSYKQFCKIRNLIQNKVKKAKNYFHKDKVEECKGSSSQFWKTLKSIGLSKGTPGSSKICLSEGEEIIFEKKLQVFLTTFLLQWQKNWLTNYLKDQYISLNNF